MDSSTALHETSDRGSPSELNQPEKKPSGGSAGSPCTEASDVTAAEEMSSVSDQALNQFTLEEVREHWSMESCWIVLFDLVYDVTDFLQEHPGGVEIVVEHAGYDSTLVFNGKGHSENAHEMLKKYLIGQLVSSERIYSSKSM